MRIIILTYNKTGQLHHNLWQYYYKPLLTITNKTILDIPFSSNISKCSHRSHNIFYLNLVPINKYLNRIYLPKQLPWTWTRMVAFGCGIKTQRWDHSDRVSRLVTKTNLNLLQIYRRIQRFSLIVLSGWCQNPSFEMKEKMKSIQWMRERERESWI